MSASPSESGKGKRPTSIASVNSLSSGTSSSSGSFGAIGSRSVHSMSQGQQTVEEEEDVEVSNEEKLLPVVNSESERNRSGAIMVGRKGHPHHRSTTLVSQYSMGE